MLRAKLHGGTITDSSLNYEGSITIDSGLLRKAGILPYEKVLVSNLMNGERFETYVLPGKRGEICLNGPTARKGLVGDKVIIFSYCYLDEKETKALKPLIIKLDAKNRPIK
jgi:aspartate 1-decarboxylase